MVKKILKTLLCMMLVLVCAAPACLPSASAAKATKILRVNANGVRLHYSAEGLGTENMILSLPKNTKVMYLGMPNKSWVRVALHNGLKGYIYKGYLSEYGAVATKDVYKVDEKRLTTYKLVKGKLKKSSSTLAKNSIVFVRDTKGPYAKILTLKGKWTYVKTKGLEKY